jgi:choline kinase
MVTGYKSLVLEKFSKKIGFQNIFNKKYSTTNMVYSLFLTKKKINQDVVIVYGDVIFNKNIYNLVNSKKNILPINVNWLKNWKQRMTFKKILNDAENLIVKNNYLIQIGDKIIKDKLPKYQFMGIIKLRKKSFIKCYKYFNKLGNKKIDMTSFLNLCIQNKIINIETKKYSDYWYEIDTISDHKFAKKDLKKW